MTKSKPAKQRSVKTLHAAIIGMRTEASSSARMMVVTTVRVESNVPTFDRIGIDQRVRGPDAVLDIELKLPMTSTREELAKAFEAFAKALRDPKLDEDS